MVAVDKSYSTAVNFALAVKFWYLQHTLEILTDMDHHFVTLQGTVSRIFILDMWRRRGLITNSPFLFNFKCVPNVTKCNKHLHRIQL